jgi:hypothetical protein
MLELREVSLEGVFNLFVEENELRNLRVSLILERLDKLICCL